MEKTSLRRASLVLLGTLCLIGATGRLEYPRARLKPVFETLFGTPIADPYRWMEFSDTADVQTWVREQNKLSEDWLSKIPRRPLLVKRLSELYDVDHLTTPRKRGARLFYTHRLHHKERAGVYWRQGDSGAEALLLDPEAHATGENDHSYGELYPSPDGSQLAYLDKPYNTDEAVLHIRIVDSGKENPGEIIPGADVADVSWAPDSKGFYYTRLPVDPKIPAANRVAYADVRFHALGTDPSQDRVVYPPTGDASVYLSPHISQDGRWLFVNTTRGWTSNNIYVQDLKTPAPRFRPLFISTGATASVIAWKDSFYLTTNDGAPHQRVFRVDPSRRDPKDWKLLVAERPNAAIEGTSIFGGHLVLKVLKDVSSLVEVRSLDGELEHLVTLPDVGSVESIYGREDDDTAYLSFESFFIAPRIYAFSTATGAATLWAQTRIPIKADPYTVDRVSYRSKDGTPISMFIIRSKNMHRDSSTPFQLLGYGGFQESMLPRFNPAIYPWLEAGGAVAIPHLRGGGEYGEEWHRAGMLAKKQNTFDDMIAAGEYLTHNGYTRLGLMVMQGSSNGGLLVGAVLTQRPDLFRAVVCKNPLLDMLRYPLYGEGRAWVPEYGSPDVEADFRALAAYSPYHQVKPGISYPSVLFISSQQDDRVDPMHARKMAASLQAATASRYPILYRAMGQAGHDGADRVTALIEEMADRLSFLLEETGRGHVLTTGTPAASPASSKTEYYFDDPTAL